MVVHPHFQLFLYVFTFVAAVCLGLLFVKQKGVADAADTLFGGAHPAVEQIEGSLQGSRAAYDARVGDDRTSTR